MRFCPACGSLLRVRPPADGVACEFWCKGCPFFVALRDDDGLSVRDELAFKPKEREDVIEARARGAVTSINCPKCAHDKASYVQQQTRSGDEASTIFYTCLKCSHTWTEN